MPDQYLNDMIACVVEDRYEDGLEYQKSRDNLIDELELENSKIFQFDSKGQPLKMFPINRVLNQDEIFAMGENIQSYDSRYFGVVNIKESNIKKVDKFLIWSEIK